MRISPSHPRAQSLKTRERLVWGIKHGLTSVAGLTAHGRGEAFDYLLGEETRSFAKTAIKTAASLLLLAKKPVLSINGNSAALSAQEFVKLARLLECKIEVNLFHYSKKRVKTIENHLKKIGSSFILTLEKQPTVILPSVASDRKVVLREGIGTADIVFVPLEDGDRCEALVKLGGKVIAVDLNPLSRTAQKATVTIVDNLVRSMPLLLKEIQRLKKQNPKTLQKIIARYNNSLTLKQAILFIKGRLETLARSSVIINKKTL